MSVFNQYSDYYDLLYKDKDYSAESSYIIYLIKKYGNNGNAIFEMGSGTGRHAQLLAKQGYNVHGLDLSEQMVGYARKSLDNHTKAQEKITFDVGDMRSVRLDKTFDTVLSLFHVMSYQISNKDLENALTTAAFHLKKGGLFIFDFWYGDAVLKQHPLVKIKRVEDDNYKITRIAEPIHDQKNNKVDVGFTLYVHDKKNDKIIELQEKHTMRYFFETEIVRLMYKTGFEVLAVEEWLTGKKPSDSSWGVCLVGRKK